MSKELSPLEALFRLVFSAVEDDTRTVEECLEYQHIIETALKRLETLEEEKKSFDRQLEKKLKALEILKEILDIKIHIDEEENVAILYVDVVKDFETKKFTHHLILGYVQDKEKYELLKEVLE